MNRLLQLALVASALSLTIGGVAIAHPPSDCHKEFSRHTKVEKKGPPPMQMSRTNIPFFLQGIELTAEQEDEIFKLTHAEAPLIRDRIKKQHALRQELVVLIQSGQFDDKQARKIANKLANLEKENALSKARIDSKIMSLLTPEQREQVIQNRKKINPMHKKGHYKPASHQMDQPARVAI